MPFLQIKISDNVAALLEEARLTGSGFEFKSTLHGVELVLTSGVKPTLSGSFNNFKVVAEPQIIIEERQRGDEPQLVAPPTIPPEPSNLIPIKLPHNKEVAIENRRNLLVAFIQRGYQPGMTQAEIKESMLKDCGVDCSVTTINHDLNELKKKGTIISFTERGLGIVYKVVQPPIEALGF